MILFVYLRYRNGCYGNADYDKDCRYEIDIVAEDEIYDRIEFIEVKRQLKNYDENALKAKSELFLDAVGSLKGYRIVYRGLSIEDM